MSEKIILQEYCHGWQKVGETKLSHWRLLRVRKHRIDIICEEKNEVT